MRPCPGVAVGPWAPCPPAVRDRLEGGTGAAPGGGEMVPVEGEVVSVSAEDVSLKRERSFLSRACMSSIPGTLDWDSTPSGSPGWDGREGRVEGGSWVGAIADCATGTEAGIGWEEVG